MLLQVCPGVFRESTFFDGSTSPDGSISSDGSMPFRKHESDIFFDLFNKLAVFYHKHNIILGDLVLALQSRFLTTKNLLSAQNSGIGAQGKFLLVLDEAQVLGEIGSQYHLSRQDSKTPRPILSPILYGLQHISNQASDFCIVPCGTGLSSYDLGWMASSGGATSGDTSEDNNENFAVINFPGWQDKSVLESYIDGLETQIPEDKRGVLRELLPPEAIDAMFLKLRGRFRPIITTIENIISKGLPTSWNSKVQEMEKQLSDMPTEERKSMRGNLCCDLDRILKRIANKRAEFKHVIDIRHTIKKSVVNMVMFGLPLILETKEPILVEAAFGRLYCLSKEEVRTALDQPLVKTVINEPFAFLAAYNYFKDSDPGFKHFVDSGWKTIPDESFKGKYWEYQVPTSLIGIFHGKKLQKSLFPGYASNCDSYPKEIFEQDARIVGWDNLLCGAVHSNMTLRKFMDAHYDGQSKIDGKDVAPFYYPPQNPSGPDIVFILQIGEHRYPVFVQMKLIIEQLYGMKRTKALETVHVDKINPHLWEKHQQKQEGDVDLDHYCGSGCYLSLMVVYPAPFVIFPEEDKGTESEPKQLLMLIDGRNISEFIDDEKIEMLKSVKGIKRVRTIAVEDDDDSRKKARAEEPMEE
jgi:hypothetical protein